MADEKSKNIVAAELKDEAEKAKLAATQARLDKEAATAKARDAAEKALAELDARRKELEAIAFADWGPGKPGRRKITVPRHPDQTDTPRINGIELVGEFNVTYDTYQQIMHMVSNRHAQQTIQERGYHKGVKVHNLSTGDIKFVDTYLLPNERR